MQTLSCLEEIIAIAAFSLVWEVWQGSLGPAVPKSAVAAAAGSSSVPVRTQACGPGPCPLCAQSVQALNHSHGQTPELWRSMSVSGHDNYKKIRKRGNTKKLNLSLLKKCLRWNSPKQDYGRKAKEVLGYVLPLKQSLTRECPPSEWERSADHFRVGEPRGLGGWF